MAVNEDFPLALCSGTVLAGQYVIEKVLGQGGFGITYKASDHKTGEKVAVKEFFPDTLAYRENTQVISYPGERDENFQYGKESFLQEAQTLAQFIGNKNIVSIHSYFEENGTAYFVMDYIEGTSFDEYLKQNGGKISVLETEKILIPIMDALGAVHSKGIVHRDVTPDNIYICNDGTVKLLDFGAARYSLGDKSRSLDVILKHGFAPKEQYTRHGRQGAYTDIYSLAATFYFAITGRRPPDSIDRLDEDDLIPPSSLGVDITDYQEKALYMALEVQPQNRFASMSAFKNVLLNENSGHTQAMSGDAASPVATSGSTSSVGTIGNTSAVVTESKPAAPKQKKFKGKKIAITSAAALVVVLGVGAAVLAPSLKKTNKRNNDNKKENSVVDAFIEDQDESSSDDSIPKETTPLKPITTAPDATIKLPEVTEPLKPSPTDPPSSSGSMALLGNINGNLVNGGLVSGDGINTYYIDDDWHAIYRFDSSGNSTRIFYDESVTFSNLCHIDNTLYYLQNGKAVYIDDGAAYSYYIEALEDYDNIQSLYITEDYYFIYVSETSGTGTLYRITKSGTLMDSLSIDYASDFTISEGNIYYSSIGDDGKVGIFKKSADNLYGSGYGISYSDMTPSFPVIDSGYLYVMFNSDDGNSSMIAKINASTMKAVTTYDISDLITSNTGFFDQLNVRDNNMFFTFYDYNNANNCRLYHISVDGENWSKEYLIDHIVWDISITPYDNGNIRINYMNSTDDSVYKIHNMLFDSAGNRIQNK